MAPIQFCKLCLPVRGNCCNAALDNAARPDRDTSAAQARSAARFLFHLSQDAIRFRNTRLCDGIGARLSVCHGVDA